MNYSIILAVWKNPDSTICKNNSTQTGIHSKKNSMKKVKPKSIYTTWINQLIMYTQPHPPQKKQTEFLKLNVRVLNTLNRVKNKWVRKKST